jgi:hypothetical protein
MRSSAREYTSEISRLRTKLFEFEISAAMDNMSGTPSNMNFEQPPFLPGMNMDNMNFGFDDNFSVLDPKGMKESSSPPSKSSSAAAKLRLKSIVTALPLGTAMNAANALRLSDASSIEEGVLSRQQSGINPADVTGGRRIV